jgi:(p)ppGpp synthase/HD superfamily hydrolase
MRAGRSDRKIEIPKSKIENPPMLTERFDDAVAFAARAHARQKRKGTDVPYVAHLLSVVGLVLEHGGTEDEAIAAVLHDAVEDQGGPPMRDKIAAKFGQDVAAIVDGCTDTDLVPKPPWRDRKQRYIDHVAAASPSVRLVSMADKLHNARSILGDVRRLGDGAFEKFAGKKEGTLWYYRALVTQYRLATPQIAPHLLEELDRVVTELERLSSM